MSSDCIRFFNSLDVLLDYVFFLLKLIVSFDAFDVVRMGNRLELTLGENQFCFSLVKCALKGLYLLKKTLVAFFQNFILFLGLFSPIFESF